MGEHSRVLKDLALLVGLTSCRRRVVGVENTWSSPRSWTSERRRYTFGVSSYQFFFDGHQTKIEHIFRAATSSNSKEVSMYIARQAPRAVGLCRQLIQPMLYHTLFVNRPVTVRCYGCENSPWSVKAGYQPRWKDAANHKIYSRARRRFTTSPVAKHGHLDPPKPGEE
jgi:hypothetical protein